MTWYLNNETIATTENTANGKVLLKLYYKKAVVFEKEYKTLKAAKAAQTILLNGKYRYIFD